MAQVLTQASVVKLKADPAGTRIIRDAASRGLFLVIQASGHRSWLMRWRRPGGGEDKITLGVVDLSGRRHDDEPQIGQPLTLVAARRLAAKINSDRASGHDVVADHKARKHRQKVALVEASANSFPAAARDFLDQHAKAKTRGWRETARNLGFDEELEPRKNGLADRWSDRDVRSLDAHDLFAVIAEARKLGTPGLEVRNEGPSESRARKLHAALSQLFTWLLRHRRIESNPITNLHPPSAPAARDRVLSDVEVKAFWAAADTLADPFKGVLKLLLITGARLAEIAELRWEEVSEDCSTLTIPGSRIKNRRPYVVPLPSMAQDIVAAQERDGTYVFSTSGGIVPVSIGSKVKGRLDAAMGDVPPWRLHDLRRTAATGMAEIGIPPHVVEAVLNHVSGFRSGVAGTYNRAAYLPEKTQALERWANQLEAIVTGRPRKVVPIRGGR
jgi:integrase